MNLQKLSTEELLVMLHKMNERLKVLEGLEAERKYAEEACDECGMGRDNSGNCACVEDDDYYETDYDREGV